MYNSGPFRVFLACVLGMTVGFLFYNEKVNPDLMKTWKNEYYPGIPDPSKVNSYEGAMLGTMVGILVLAICINRYVNYRQVPTSRLLRMSFELWLMTVCLQGPNVLWTAHSTKGFAIDQIYTLLLITTISLAVGYNRFGNHIAVD